jgi:hypothetical protein
METRLIEAADALHKLPPIIPSAYWCSWPEFIRDDVDLHVNTMAVPRHSRATPREIKQMEEAISWLKALPRLDATIVWMRVNRKSWRVIGETAGLCRMTLRRHYKAALAALAQQFNTKSLPSTPLLPLRQTRRNKFFS